VQTVPDGPGKDGGDDGAGGRYARAGGDERANAGWPIRRRRAPARSRKSPSSFFFLPAVRAVLLALPSRTEWPWQFARGNVVSFRLQKPKHGDTRMPGENKRPPPTRPPLGRAPERIINHYLNTPENDAVPRGAFYFFFFHTFSSVRVHLRDIFPTRGARDETVGKLPFFLLFIFRTFVLTFCESAANSLKRKEVDDRTLDPLRQKRPSDKYNDPRYRTRKTLTCL